MIQKALTRFCYIIIIGGKNMKLNLTSKLSPPSKLTSISLAISIILILTAFLYVSGNRIDLDNNDHTVVSIKVDGSFNNKAELGKPVEEQKKPEPKEVLIYIDPGHGGLDEGTYYGSLLEKDVNLEISLILGEMLKNDGIKYQYTREKDVDVGLTERAEMANQMYATLFLSIHHNNMPDNSEYKGTETLYCPNQDATKIFNGEKFADIVQDELVKKMGTIDIGTIARPNLAVLHRTKMPAVIAEIGYISNESDRAKIRSREYKERAASGLYLALIKSLDALNAKKDSNGVWLIEDLSMSM